MSSSTVDMQNRLNTRLTNPGPALRPPSTYPGIQAALENQPNLLPAPAPSLVVQHTPANQPDLQPDITNSRIAPQQSSWAAQRVQQSKVLTEGLMKIFETAPSSNMMLTPDMREALEGKLALVGSYLSKFPGLFENLGNRYNGQGPSLDLNNPQQKLAHQYFAWQEHLDQQLGQRPSPAPGA